MTERQRILDETETARQRAEGLLRGLLDARAKCEQNGLGGSVDPLKRVTGRSSMDNAIASTRRMIESLDRALTDFKRELHEQDLDLVAGGPRTRG